MENRGTMCHGAIGAGTYPRIL